MKNNEIVAVGGTPYTVVEGLNAFANYVKHCEEWPHDWTQLQKNNEKLTAPVIQAFGGAAGKHGQFTGRL